MGSETYKEPVTTEDLAQFMKMLDCTDGGPSWQQIMDRSVSGMTYQAYRRDPEVMNCFAILTCKSLQVKLSSDDLYNYYYKETHILWLNVYLECRVLSNVVKCSRLARLNIGVEQ